MSILLINRDKGIKLSEILSEVKHELVVLSMYDLPDSDEFKYFEVIPNLRDLTYYLELKAIELHQEYYFKKVIAEDEFDLIRAARLREYFNIEGQTVESAVAFRDKVKMKDYLKGKVDLPEYQALTSASVLHDFVRNYGFPIVVKPRDKAGAQGVNIINNQEELYNFSKTKWDYDLQIETFISGDMYHVDAVVEEGNITMLSVSKYINSCLSFFSKNNILGSYQIHPEAEMYKRLEDYFKKVLSFLPTPRVCAYHMEVFHTKEDKIILCEIASRIGGGYILDTFKQAYSVDVLSYLYRRWCDLPVDKPSPKNTNKLFGFLLIPPQDGVLLSIPEEIKYDWVLKYDKNGEVGKRYNNPSYFTDKIAGIMIEGHSSQDVLDKLFYIENWYNNEVKWDLSLDKEPEKVLNNVSS
jgi:ATP-grasp domain